MAKALLADGKTLVDLKGATIQAGDGEKFAALMSGGDANANSIPDFTLTHSVRVPLIGRIDSAPATHDLPVDQVLAFLQTASPALAAVPGVGPAISAGVAEGLVLARAVFKKF